MVSGSFLYIAMTNAKPQMADEYEEWAVSHHLADVLAIDEVTSAQQFRFVPTREGVVAPFAYAAIYTAGTDDIASVHARILEARREGRMTDTSTLDEVTSAHWYAPISELLRK